MIIRQATTADVQGIAAVQFSGWQTAYHGLITDDFLAGLQLTHFEEGTLKSLPDVFVAEIAGNIVGMCAYGPGRDDETLGEVRAFYVAPTMQRQGVGRALMTHVLTHCLQQYAVIYLWVLQGNQPAINFYQTMGFQPTTDRKALTFKDCQVDEQRFVLYKAAGAMGNDDTR